MPTRLPITASAIVWGVLTIAVPLFGANKEKLLYNFPSNSGGFEPEASLIFDKAGNLYGTTYSGGAYECGYDFGCGTIFELTPDGNGQWTETMLHDFTGGEDSCSPLANLIFDAAGNLYGTASGAGDVDGPCNNGTVFELSPGQNGTWTFKVLYGFSNRDGAFPEGLVFDAAGNLYGITEGGGPSDGGTVFELSQGENGTWTEKVLNFFSYQGQFGFNPVGGLVLDKAGNLYGITCCGGVYGNTCGPSYFGCGVVFELTPEDNGEWTERVVHNFNYTDGDNAAAGLISDAAGNLYGTTQWGGVFGYGIVFELSAGANGNWTERVLHSFSLYHEDGTTPAGQLIFDTAGNLYGTTSFGGSFGSQCGNSYNCGTVFELTPGVKTVTWTERVLHRFNGTDGAFPLAGLIFDSEGNLYGDTMEGGSYGSGAVFEIVRR